MEEMYVRQELIKPMCVFPLVRIAISLVCWYAVCYRVYSIYISIIYKLIIFIQHFTVHGQYVLSDLILASSNSG